MFANQKSLLIISAIISSQFLLHWWSLKFLPPKLEASALTRRSQQTLKLIDSIQITIIILWIWKAIHARWLDLKGVYRAWHPVEKDPSDSKEFKDVIERVKRFQCLDLLHSVRMFWILRANYWRILFKRRRRVTVNKESKTVFLTMFMAEPSTTKSTPLHQSYAI